MRIDEQRRRQINTDTLVKDVFRITLKGGTSTAESKLGEAIWERDSRNPAQGVSDNTPTSTESVPDEHTHAELPGAPTVSENLSHTRALYDLVLATDHKIEEHVNVVAATLKSGSAMLDHLLKQEERWFRDTIHNVHAVNPGGDEATRILREAMIDRLLNQLSLIESERKARGHIANANMPDKIFATGKQFLPQYNTCVEDARSAEKFYTHPLQYGNPLVVISMFLVIVLNVFGHLARPSCNFALRILKCLLQCALENDGNLTDSHKRLLKDFPADIRSVRKAFDIEPTITIYAACPKCCFTHKPTRTKSGIDIYPSRCQYVRYKGHRNCGARITKQTVQHGLSVRTPIRPFAYHSFPAFVAGLVSRPGVEDMMVRTWQGSGNDDILDLWDASGVHELEGPVRKPGAGKKLFSDCPDGELRLVWSLSIDWFNPYQNKAAGKSASVGSMAMACLNLPPSIRYKPEYLYLNIIPGPREPKTDEINHFQRPLVDDLEECYEEGTFYSRTYRYLGGRRVTSAVCISVADLPGARKTGGGTGTSSGWISPFYTSQRRDNINNIDETVSLKASQNTHFDDVIVDMGPPE